MQSVKHLGEGDARRRHRTRTDTEHKGEADREKERKKGVCDSEDAGRRGKAKGAYSVDPVEGPH